MSTEQIIAKSNNSGRNAIISVLFYNDPNLEVFENYYVSSLLLGERLAVFKHITESSFDSIIIVDYETYRVLNRHHKYENMVKKFDRVVISDENKGYFLKLEAWKLIADYDKIVYLDLDCWIVNPQAVDLLFGELKESTHAKIFAANEITWPDMFNTGVFGIKKETATPYSDLKGSKALFETLKSSDSEEVSLYDDLDQGFFNFLFSDSWKKISYVFNVQLRGSNLARHPNVASDTYFITNPRSQYFEPTKTNPSAPHESDTYFSTYSEFSSGGSLSQPNKRFLEKALVFQFMEKPWQSTELKFTAPDYFSNFDELKQTNIFEKDDTPTIIPDVSSVSFNDIEHQIAEIVIDKKDLVPPKQKKNVFLFPWDTYQDFPTSNSRVWK